MACNIFDFGVLGHCDIVTTDLCLTSSGEYYLAYTKNGIKNYVPIVIENDNDPIIIDMSKFPVNTELIVEVYNSNMQKYAWDDDYEQLKFFSTIKTIGNTGFKSEYLKEVNSICLIGVTCIADLPAYPTPKEANEDVLLLVGSPYKLDGSVAGTIKDMILQKS